ncbi:MAG: DUF3127 domain-containing protein [Verrucomicrobiales bacterium]|nr:DUF3127 domain-containing protein [Verrucomicrobiales bacterium]
MANGFEIEGTVHLINEIQTFDSGFTKREFVVEVMDGKFPQMLKFECLKDKTSLLDGLNKGDAIKVNFDIRGNEYNGRFYVNLNAWKIERSGGSTGTNPSEEGGDIDHTISEPPAGYGQPDTSDDIPF